VSQQPPLAEPELVQRLRAGDPKALEQAYDQHAPTIYRIGYRLLGETADAEDLVHDVFVSLTRAVRTFEGRGSFEHWLKRVAARTALMKLRQQRAHRQGLLRHGWRFARSTGHTAMAEQMDLEHALQQLDAPLRTVFVLKDVEGYSHEEIAELLGITVGATRVRLYRARRRLRAYLEND
jgi:RNA polymerase sigma-70 factor (ECF subfamily)